MAITTKSLLLILKDHEETTVKPYDYLPHNLWDYECHIKLFTQWDIYH